MRNVEGLYAMKGMKANKGEYGLWDASKDVCAIYGPGPGLSRFGEMS